MPTAATAMTTVTTVPAADKRLKNMLFTLSPALFRAGVSIILEVFYSF